MFDIGWGEFVVIGIVALIAIGPKELPGVLRTAGQWMGKIKRMAGEFQGQFNEALREAEMADIKKHADELTSAVSTFDPMANAQKEMESAFGGNVTPPPGAAEVAADTAANVPAAPLPEIAVALPDELPPVSEKDFASAEPEPPKETQKQAGGGA
jgi:sec-independent protein translocase protein TatB